LETTRPFAPTLCTHSQVETGTGAAVRSSPLPVERPASPDARVVPPTTEQQARSANAHQRQDNAVHTCPLTILDGNATCRKLLSPSSTRQCDGGAHAPPSRCDCSQPPVPEPRASLCTSFRHNSEAADLPFRPTNTSHGGDAGEEPVRAKLCGPRPGRPAQCRSQYCLGRPALVAVADTAGITALLPSL
jgi:hypothetical protein